MKVNIEMEGTPQEVAECIKLIGHTGISVKPPNPTHLVPTTVPFYPIQWMLGPQITSGDSSGSIENKLMVSKRGIRIKLPDYTPLKTNKCPNEGHPCFCTGACHTTDGHTLDIRI